MEESGAPKNMRIGKGWEQGRVRKSIGLKLEIDCKDIKVINFSGVINLWKKDQVHYSVRGKSQLL